MIIIASFIAVVLGIMVFPMLIPFLLILYMVLDGVASRQFMHEFKFSAGGTNILLPDLLYAACLFLVTFAILRLIFNKQLRRFPPLSKTVVLLTLCYFVFFTGKIVNGYLGGVPIDSLVRHFASDTQCVYLFLPLFYLKQEKTLKQLLYFVLVISILFPLAQPFLYGSADQVSLEQGQGGTLRLGFGNANVLLMLGALAFFVWERKIWLSALPLAGIAMLAQRSAFVSITVSIMLLSFIKKKSMKFIILIGLAGILLIAALVVIQATSSVPVIDKAAERLLQTFEKTGTTRARIEVIPMALEEFGKRPWVGLSYHDIYLLKQVEDSDAFAFNMLHPHNFVLSSLLRTGTLGTVLLFAIIILSMSSALSLSRQRNTEEQGMYLSSTILFFVVFGVMNTSFISAGSVFWTLAGISLWYLNQAHFAKYQQQVSK